MTYWLRALLACNGGFTPRVLTPLCSSIIELQFALTYRQVVQEELEPTTLECSARNNCGKYLYQDTFTCATL